MIITALTPGNASLQLDVADGLLVFDGRSFVEPSKLSYIELYTLPVEALSAEHRDLVEPLLTRALMRALVVGKNPQSVPDTDPSVIVAPDPPDGNCVCALTCSGTDLRFVTVYPEP